MYLTLLSTEPRDLQVVIFKKKKRDTKKINFRTEPLKPCTSVKPLQKDILLVKLSRIDATAAALLKEKLTAYHKNKPLKLIIDLRTYCGGDFESFTKITNLFFKDTRLLTLKYKNREEDFLLGSGDALEYKAVVIINRSTRMYGELLAAMFKNSGPPSNRPAALVGTSTHGFISRLKPIPLKDGSSILLTEGLFLLNDKPTTPGVDPDIVVKDKESAEILDKCIPVLNPDPADPGSSTREKNENGKKKRKTQ
jgi:C-terminal processing protease CtpA/Prc